jgi:hypothetical protein
MRLTAVTFRSLEAGTYEFWINGGKFAGPLVTLANTDVTFTGRKFLDGQEQHDFELRMIGGSRRIRYFNQTQSSHFAFYGEHQAANFVVGMQSYPPANPATPAWSFQIEALPALKTMIDVSETDPQLGQVLGYTGGMWEPIDVTQPLITSLVRTDNTVPESLSTYSDGTFQHIDLSLHEQATGGGGGGEPTTGWWLMGTNDQNITDGYVAFRRTGNVIEWVVNYAIDDAIGIGMIPILPASVAATALTPSGTTSWHDHTFTISDGVKHAVTETDVFQIHDVSLGFGLEPVDGNLTIFVWNKGFQLGAPAQQRRFTAKTSYTTDAPFPVEGFVMSTGFSPHWTPEA